MLLLDVDGFVKGGLAVRCMCANTCPPFLSPPQTAVKTRCSSMHFIVAEGNQASIEFYKRRGAADLSLEEGWRLFKIDKSSLLKMSSGPEE